VKVTVGELRRIIREVLAINCYVDRSRIPGAGEGLFAAEDIEPGEVVSRWHDGVDQTFAEEELTGMDSVERQKFEDFASWDGDRWYLSGDDSKYMNHSSKPNLGVAGGDAPSATRDRIALRSIKAGDELTIDYNEVGTDGF
jgi:SET domain-containing protein